MSETQKSVVFALPVAGEELANRLWCALGLDGAPLPGRSFSVRLSNNGQEPASHVACRMQTKQSLLDLVQEIKQDVLPTVEWPDYGIAPQQAKQVVGALIIDVRDWDVVKANGGTGTHLPWLAAQRGKQIIEPRVS